MPYTRFPVAGRSGSSLMPEGVKWLLIANTAIFVIQFFAVQAGYGSYFLPLALMPQDVVEMFAVWQLVTYMFLHDPTGFGHILFNMLSLWMFGKDLENVWGTRRFLKYYFLCGIGAGLCVILANSLFGSMATRTIGASGAIYGVLLAFGLLFPDVTVLFGFLFPIKAKYFVMIIGAIAFMSSLGASGGGVSHVAHLGGMIFGYLYLRSPSSNRKASHRLGRLYHDWRVRRAKKKFQVYLRKHGSDRQIH